LTPVQVQGLNDAVAIAAGAYVSWAIRADGSVVVWERQFNPAPAHPPWSGWEAWERSTSICACMSFTPQVDVPLSTQRLSNTIVLTGIADGSAISVAGGDYRIDSGAFVTAAGTINNGQSVTLRQPLRRPAGRRPRPR
jgi:hypothetical protein